MTESSTKYGVSNDVVGDMVGTRVNVEIFILFSCVANSFLFMFFGKYFFESMNIGL
jgi:hypothetical protein